MWQGAAFPFICADMEAASITTFREAHTLPYGGAEIVAYSIKHLMLYQCVFHGASTL